MKFIDAKKKDLHWYNKNYFWMVTLLYIVLNIVIFACLGPNNLLSSLERSHWQVFDGIREWLIAIGNLYTHFDWSHVLHNMLGFLFGAFYLERKMGSVNFAMLLLVLSLFGSAVTSMAWGLAWIGNSVIWFALWGYVLIDFLFSFRKEQRSITNIIIGAVVLMLEYIRSGFFDTSNGGIGWGLLPYQLIYNAGHYLGFIVGAIFALVIQIISLQTKKHK